jgi:hypothetical protein
MGESSHEFWNNHPDALRWSTQNPDITANLTTSFCEWIADLIFASRLPIVMVALPHSYDARQLLDILQRSYNMSLLDHLLFADSAELYATKHNLPLAEGKAEFKRLFMPNLVHEPTLDSMVQLNATIAGLLHKRT